MNGYKQTASPNVMLKPKHISDQQILDWILSGAIRMTHLDTSNPQLIFHGRHVRAELVEQSGKRRLSGTKRYSFSFQYKGMRRRIVRAKLVWMVVHKSLVPGDCLVHHEDKNCLNDHPDNLHATDYETHMEIHYGKF